MNTSPPALLGIDLGASSLKATLLNPDKGTVLATSSQPISTHYPYPNWSEQDPQHWYRALCDAVLPLAAKHNIIALSISAGAHIPVLLDHHNQPVRPAIMWNDQRSAEQAAWLRQHHGKLIEQTALNRANPTWTLPMLAWLKQHEPNTLARVERLCLAKDYLRLCLCGEWHSDISDAIGALLGDYRSQNWSPELCALIDWPLATLPPLKSATAVAGEITATAAKATGLTIGTPVMIGSNDTTVELFGSGAIQVGEAAIKLATAGVLFLTVDRPIIKPPISCYPHLLEGLYYLATGTNSCASAHRWARDRFFPELSFEQFDHLASSVPAGAGGVIFHPYLQGERGPHWNPDLRADFIGLTMSHERGHIARAVYEGIAYSINDLLFDARQKGLNFTSARLLGGGAKSACWRQVMADVTGLEMLIPEHGDASFASALVAGIGTGMFTHPIEAIKHCVNIVEHTQPSAQQHDLYQELFTIYQDAQCALASIDQRLGQLLQGK